MKHQPASPLPWRWKGDLKHARIVGPKGVHVDEIPLEAFGDDAKRLRADLRYLVHAGNAYPRLLAVVDRLAAALRANGAPNCEAMKERRALLAALGEGS